MNKPAITLTYGLGIVEAFIMGFTLAQKYFVPAIISGILILIIGYFHVCKGSKAE
ncbi:hypothetical protein CHN56_00189 [Bacillus velezensis]|uniref:hypothetical protein n=1 Tax=Bacillus amyloliquefaciens group TaxID=1938374 RepID=UPI000B92ECA2|nr:MULTISPECIES: hypothetical protein [Bacillus amyloliquefaciens group]ASS60734.1 hypothetical protein CHN56_00189 [Bacillus velezensis]MCX4184160.1 hypothetical protein [Bacillus amyloliquefaciens]